MTRIAEGRARWPGLAGPLCLLLLMGACGESSRGDVEFSLVGGETMTGRLGFAMRGEEITEAAPDLTAKVGEKVTIAFENAHGQYSPTTATHDVAIVPKLDDLPTLAATGAVDDVILWGAATPEIPSGESSTVTFVPDAPGAYYYMCTVPGHVTGGMIGEFVVER